jgi:bacterioferritin (cytochrome b1)
MCDNWVYFRLGAYYRKESIEEMVHAEKLMNRILFLEGTPNMSDIGKRGSEREGAVRERSDSGVARRQAVE